MSVIAIPRSIRERLGDEASEDFASLINDIDLGARKDAIAIAEERFERRLSEVSGTLRLEMEKLRVELRVEMEKLRADVSNIKAEIIKWMFLFWIGQTAAMIAVIKFLVVK
ncbi:LA_3696 family protein [Candidatus Magnetominusculus dajiuhuensis]|uniref:LA_3696 family protein n=1 Tax=Candidatus Magnetominusculus dajiuhuensis TaxID=3137712 RepID=UPI003B42AF31